MEITATVGMPRSPSREDGVSFSATVLGQAGAHRWRLKIGAEVVLISSSLTFTPGQTLILKRWPAQPQHWTVWSDSPDRSWKAPSELLSSFLGQGLPLVSQTLDSWAHWLAREPAPKDRSGWAAMAEAGGLGPSEDGTATLEAWLGWLAGLEAGQTPPPPTDDSFWDAWNLRRLRTPVHWLAMPLRWTYQQIDDTGFLQARWNESLKGIDRWIVTACPGSRPMRVDADVSKHRLDLHCWFFQTGDREQFASWLQAHPASLSHEALQVSVHLALRPLFTKTAPPGPINVKA